MKRTATDHVVSIGLSTAIVWVAEERPRVLVVHRAGEVVDALPLVRSTPSITVPSKADCAAG